MDFRYKIRRGLYIISPEQITDLKQFATNLKFILKNVQIPYFQLRLKNVTENFIIEAIQILKPICIKFNTEFILNDNPMLAAQYGLDGVHVGKEDGDLKHIIRTFNGVIGVSCYNNLDKALEIASLNGIQYVSLGAFYPSKTKPNALSCPLSCLIEFKKKSQTPVCVIGGINFKNAEELIKNGADLVAISSAIWDITKNSKRVDELKNILKFFN